jgi:mannose-6-phosphate isomerase-like protein (cupin superfamily)
MRRLITGVDEAGRSRVVNEDEVTFAEATPGTGWSLAYQTQESPPPSRPPGRGDFLAVAPAPGLVSWNLIEWQPDLAWPMHHTDSIDFDLVLSGSVELILDDGSHVLGPGDCVVIAGVDHAWRVGPDGCRLNAILLGTPPLP